MILKIKKQLLHRSPVKQLPPIHPKY